MPSEERTAVMIVGHTDSDGSDPYNQQLSERRGRAAEDYLASQNVGSSPRQPRPRRGRADRSNGTEEGRSQNRRVEVAIYANDQWRDEATRASNGHLILESRSRSEMRSSPCWLG